MGFDRSRYGQGREAQGSGGGGEDDATLWNYREEWNPGEMREVVFERTREPTGAMKSPMHYFKDENGDSVKMWGCTVLDDKLSDARKGDLLEITYKGKSDPVGPGNPYHDFDIVVFAGPDATREPAPRDDRRPTGARDDRRPSQPPRDDPRPRGDRRSTASEPPRSSRGEPERLPPQDDEEDIPF